jgi:hypothetical protein
VKKKGRPKPAVIISKMAYTPVTPNPTEMSDDRPQYGKRKLTPCSDATAPVPASLVLQRLHDQAPKDHFTLGWLLSGLSGHSFGVLLLLLSVIAIAPGASIVAGALLLIPALEMIADRPSPTFPGWIADRRLPAPHLAALVQRAVPVLKIIEKVVHPRWPTLRGATKRLVGVIVAILGVSLVFIPIPFSNVVPALVIALLSLAYLEEDGLLLLIGLLAALVVLTVEFGAIWGAIHGAKWIIG